MNSLPTFINWVLVAVVVGRSAIYINSETIGGWVLILNSRFIEEKKFTSSLRLLKGEKKVKSRYTGRRGVVVFGSGGVITVEVDGGDQYRSSPGITDN